MKLKTSVGIVIVIILEGVLFLPPLLAASALVGIVVVCLADKILKI